MCKLFGSLYATVIQQRGELGRTKIIGMNLQSRRLLKWMFLRWGAAAKMAFKNSNKRVSLWGQMLQKDVTNESCSLEQTYSD